MKVLVHYDSTGNEALGLWWVDATQSPQSLYRNPGSPEEARGRMLVFNKSNENLSWVDWFDLLTTRAPYSEDWAVYDSMGFSPEQMLQALQPSKPLVS